MITTSAFTREAQEWVLGSGSRIALVDGMRLAHLLAEHNEGVQAAAPFVLKKVDQDFFEAL